MNQNNDIEKLTVTQLMEHPFITGGVSVNFSQNNIVRDGETYVLQPKVLQLLLLLCCAQGETLSKQKLITALWPDTIVGPDSLANSMARLRKSLNDDVKSPEFIQTVQRKGYRWLQPVILTKHSSSWFAKWSLAKKYTLLFLIIFGIVAVMFLPSFLAKHEPENAHKEFFFPDLAIKKLPDGGYEIQAGIDGKLTPEKKAAMLKEIKRITGEEHSDMVFTVDQVKPTCEHLQDSDENKKAIACEDKQ